MPYRTRRLSDKVLIAFHSACDQADFGVASLLLNLLETLLIRVSATNGNRQHDLERLVAAHSRLWELRHHPKHDR